MLAENAPQLMLAIRRLRFTASKAFAVTNVCSLRLVPVGGKSHRILVQEGQRTGVESHLTRAVKDLESAWRRVEAVAAATEYLEPVDEQDQATMEG